MFPTLWYHSHFVPGAEVCRAIRTKHKTVEQTDIHLVIQLVRNGRRTDFNFVVSEMLFITG